MKGQRFIRPMEIGEPKALVLADLERLYEPRTIAPVKKLRHSHHQVAMLVALGASIEHIQAMTGYSQQRQFQLGKDPAFQALVQTLAERRDQAMIDKGIDILAQMTDVMTISVRQIRDRLEEADEVGELIPLRDALKITAEMADRVGYGKHSTQHNYNVNFASTLEERIRKRNSSVTPNPPVIEATPAPQATAVVPFIRRRLGDGTP